MKKLFRLSAMVAIVSMMATATVATSCSDDDDDDPVILLKDTTFTVTMGGELSNSPSFLSIKDAKAYKQSMVAASPENIEIVFNGTSFISAKDCMNSVVNTNGRSAVITQTSPLRFDYVTSTGFKGSLTLTEEPGDASADYVVTVVRQKN